MALHHLKLVPIFIFTALYLPMNRSLAFFRSSIPVPLATMSRFASVSKMRSFSTLNSIPDRLMDDNLITCLNGAQDITVKVLSFANLMQQSIDRLSLSQQVA